jgi:5'-deoxynucleotidase YfbR-like HD superfamily hydrolase
MSGKHVDPLNLQPTDLDIRDIAHNLSLLCRYTGAFPFHYSVAQHSILVADMAMVNNHNKEVQLACLLHDAAEYVFGDVNYHLKRLPELAEYNRREHATSKMIIEHFGCNPELMDTIVKHYDREAAAFEMNVRDGMETGIYQYEPKTIYHRFLSRFETLADIKLQTYHPAPRIPLSV